MRKLGISFVPVISKMDIAVSSQLVSMLNIFICHITIYEYQKMLRFSYV